MDIRTVAKAVAGTAVAVATTGTTIFATVPEGVEMPWAAWLGLGVFNALIGFGVVYFAPRNREV